MEKHLLNEMFRLLYQHSKKRSEKFVSFFEESTSIAAFDYNQNTKRFTEVSRSIRELLGFKNVFLLTDASLLKHLIHPEDLPLFNQYFNSQFIEVQNKTSNMPEVFIKRMNCRMRHIKGYWKQLIFISLEYTDIRNNCKHKIGIIAELAVKPKFTLTNNIQSHRESNSISNNIDVHEVSVTRREHEILELIGQGLITKEIANILNIGDTTVISHRKNLITKFKVKNTAELICHASKLLLI